MAEITELLASFAEAARNPRAQMEKHLAAGKRVMGVGPYYVPEELAHAAGAVPFGVWGAVGPAVEAKQYFPPFYCSLCQTTLEMGLAGKLDKLCGLMSTGLCDTLRAFSQNWRAGVAGIPLVYVSQPQNRFLPAGRDYAVTSYNEVKRKVEECCGNVVSDDALRASIALYNRWRAAMRRFVRLAGQHPAEVGALARNDVISAGYFMEKGEHLALVEQLNEALDALPASLEGYKPIVLSGIYEDIPALVEILEQNRFAIVADDVAKESRAFALEVAEDAADPVAALADAWCALAADSVLFDPKKQHIDKVVSLAKDAGARGVVLLLAKFCDPEEFDAPLLAKACREAGVPFVSVEVDQSTESYEQARTQLETFGEII